MEVIDSWYVDSTQNADLRFKVELVKDLDTTDKDFKPDDAYSPEDWEAWRRDEWEFAVVTVTPVYKGTVISGRDDTLGGVEWGKLPGAESESDRKYYEESHPLPEMIDAVMDNLADKPITLDDLAQEERDEYTEAGLPIVEAELTELYLVAKRLKENKA